jgi:hypothetical protein
MDLWTSNIADSREQEMFIAFVLERAPTAKMETLGLSA